MPATSSKRSREVADPRPKREKVQSGGLFGGIRRLFYWCVVLGIWGTIGVVGLVIYFAAQMPSASS